MLQTFFMLIAAHCLADYALQGDFMAKAKSRLYPIPGVPWYQAMGAHATIHGGFVALITGVPLLGIFEGVCHFVIDDLKCQGRLSFNQDQALHVLCKIVWVVLLLTIPTL